MSIRTIDSAFYLSAYQESFLVGTLLGDSRLNLSVNSRYPCLYIEHGPNQLDYAKWKVQQLHQLFPVDALRPTFVRAQLKSYRAVSFTHECLLYFYNQFSLRPKIECTQSIFSKMITSDLLGRVDDVALALWFGDDGTLERNKRGSDSLVWLLGGMTESEYLLVFKWMKDRFGPVSLYRDDLKGRGNYVRIRLSVEAAKPLAKRLSIYLPPFMHYKLGDLV